MPIWHLWSWGETEVARIIFQAMSIEHSVGLLALLETGFPLVKRRLEIQENPNKWGLFQNELDCN